jgi:septum formation protein
VPGHPEQRHELVLASASPRRREILSQLGLQFRVLASGADEGQPGTQTPEAYARWAAEHKCAAVAAQLAAERRAAFVLGADTIVVIDGGVLGKPSDERDAARMLQLLQGRTHEVITAVRVQAPAGGLARTIAVRSRVQFRVLDAQTIARYAVSGEGADKAGAYAVQGLGAGLVRAIEGSYSNVVGLPACETLELLHEAGVIGAWP